MLTVFIGLQAPSAAELRAIVDQSNVTAMRESEAAHTLPGPNRPGTDRSKVRVASVDSFERELGVDVLREMDVAMCNTLVEPLRTRWLKGKCTPSLFPDLSHHKVTGGPT